MSKYALTAKEREWLEKRKNRFAPCGSQLVCCHGGCLIRLNCPLHPDYQDSAEFEARVAIALLDIDLGDVPCSGDNYKLCPAKHFRAMYCGDWCRMRMAHLQAEQEMENN